jgi:hypothetical protein
VTGRIRTERVSARVPRDLHRALMLETWRREACEQPGATLAELVELGIDLLPDELEVVEDVLGCPPVRRALAARTEVHMQPRISAHHASRVRLLARSLSFHGRQVSVVTDRHIVVAGSVAVLSATPEAHNPYEQPISERDGGLVTASRRVLDARSRSGSLGPGPEDTPTP